MGAYSLLPWLRGLWTIDKRPASTPEPCDATHNLDTRRDHGPQDPRSSALAGILEPLGGGQAPKRIQLGAERAGRGKPVSPRFDSTLDITARKTSPIGRHSERVMELDFRSATRGRVDTIVHPSRTAPCGTDAERGRQVRKLGQKAGTLTQRYGTQLNCRRHLQGGEPRRNTGKQLDTCDSPCLEERGTDDALRGVRPTRGGGLGQVGTQLRRKLGRNTTRRYRTQTRTRLQTLGQLLLYAVRNADQTGLPRRNAPIENHRARGNAGLGRGLELTHTHAPSGSLTLD